LYARQNLFEGLEEAMGNRDTGSDSEYFSEKKMEEVD